MMQKIILTLLIILSFSASATNVVIRYDRTEESNNTGFFDRTPRTPTATNPAETLGEARRYVFEYAATIIESQVHSDADIYIAAKFGSANGFTAITYVIASEHTEYHNYDEFGILKDGVHYPDLIRRMLQGNNKEVAVNDEDGVMVFAPYENNYEIDGQEHTRFLNLVLHEFVHALGFVNGLCFNENCSEADSKIVTSFSPHLHAASPFDKPWHELNRQQHQQAVQDDLVYYHGTNADGKVSGQSLGHISANVEMTELMKSRVGNTTSFGAAAYILCDIGWCRNDGWVTDFELHSESELVLDEEELAQLNYVVSNPSDKSLEPVFVKLVVAITMLCTLNFDDFSLRV